MPNTNRVVTADGHIPILDDIYDQSSRQKCPLGTRLIWADGRIYRYAGNSSAGALTVGQMVQNSVQVVQFSSAGAYLIATAGLTAGNKVLTANSTAAAASAAANAFESGFLSVAVGSGAGYMYQVKEHGAISSNSSFSITLHEPIQVTLTSQSSLALTYNPFKNVIASPASASTGIPIGGCPMAVTASYYFWLQTWGLFPALNGGTAVTAGLPIAIATNTAGGVTSVVSAVRSIGQQYITSTASGFQLVYLTCSA